MSLATNVSDLATAVGTQLKSHKVLINGNAADLSALRTTAKSDLVAAVNEVTESIASASGIDDTTESTSTSWSSSKTRTEISAAVADVSVDLTDLIDDETASTTAVYSSTQTEARIVAAREALLGGAGPAYDTLGELQSLLQDSGDAVAANTTALGTRVRFDAEQQLDTTQRTQARANIGAASAADLGDVSTDPVAAFEAALAS